MTRKRNAGPALQPAPHVPIIISVVALLSYLTLAIVNILTTSPTVDEPTHLAAGYSYLQTGDYRLNAEHPPLLKKLAALPLLSMHVTESPRLEKPWADALTGPLGQWLYAHELFFGLRDAFLDVPTTEPLPRSAFLNDADSMFTRARLVLLLFGVLACVVVFAWAREAWGWWGAALATVLVAFDPSFLGHGGLVTTDVGVAALMCAALYFFWRALRRFTWWDASAFAAFFALAQIAKFSALTLIPMVLLIALFHRTRKAAMVIALAAAATLLAIWSIYGFRFRASSEPLRMRIVVDDWYATKALLQQYPDGPPEQAVQALRDSAPIGLFGKSLLFAYDRHLLPEAYLFGLASTMRSSLVRPSFLGGEFSNRGFPSYFLRTFLYKTSIPAIALILVALFLARKTRSPALPFLLVPVALYMLVSMTSSLNIGHRHILPIYPLLYVLCGSLAKHRAALLGGALAALSALIVLPASPMWGRHLSYMNEFAGGPGHGYEELLDSNFDWGQDLERLGEKRFGEPVNLVYFGSADPRYYGVPHVNLPFGHWAEPAADVSQLRVPGYLAISAGAYEGLTASPGMREYWKRKLESLGAQRVGEAGYSIFIYRLGARTSLSKRLPSAAPRS
ncbi:MAG TPA: glycosyltransferase family 39 protein [Thermoanaerobaculia bacterium]|nr:glycosyltransferase family 39 protein [Thermoanaerobaculia bacterium]